MKVMSFTSATTSFGLPTALISLLLAACSNEPPCIEYERTIDHGIYGQVVYKTFMEGDTPLYDVLLTVNRLDAAMTARTRSSENGLFQFELPDGSGIYTVCSDFGTVGCTTNITFTTVFRVDLVAEEQTSVYWDDNNFGDCQ